MFVCHSTATVARQCDVGLDKVSHQQYGQAGGCRVRVIQRRGDDGPRRCCSREPASRIVYYTAVRDIPETRRAVRHARAQRGATAATAGRLHAIERTIVHDGVARDVPFLGAALKRYRRRCTFLQPAGRRVFFGVARTIM